MSEDAIRRRVEDALLEAGGALEDLRRLAAGLGEGGFDEASHASAKGRLRAALSHLESLRPQHPVKAAGEHGTTASQTKTTRRLDRAVKRNADERMAGRKKAVERWENEGGATKRAKKGGAK